MKVKRLLEILRACDPDAFVTIGVPDCRREHVEKLTDTPACLLHFLIEEHAECSYSDFPHLPPMGQVEISASLDGRFYDAAPGDTDDEGFTGTVVSPDLHPEAN